MGLMGGHAYPGGGMSLPRPYPGSSGGGLQQNRGSYDSADRIAAMYGTIRHPHRRPHSTVVPPQGEGIGRDGGLCEQQFQKPLAPDASAHSDVTSHLRTSQLSPSGQMPHSAEETAALKQSVQEQLQQLVRELEAGENPLPEAPLIPPLPEAPLIPSDQQSGYAQYENFPIPVNTSIPTCSMTVPPGQGQNTETITLVGASQSDSTTINNFPQTKKTHLGPPPIPDTSAVKSIEMKGSMNNQVPVNFETQTNLNNNQIIQETAPYNQTPITATSIPVCPTTTSNSVSPLSVTQSNLALGDHGSHGAMIRCSGSDQVGYNAILDISREEASSPPNSDGIPEGGISRATASSEDWLRSRGPVVRSADNIALEAYRRSRGKGTMQEYQRGKSEDLRQTIDALAKIETTNTQDDPAPATNIYSNIPLGPQTIPSTLGIPGGSNTAAVASQEDQNYLTHSSDSANVNDSSKNVAKANVSANTVPRVSTSSSSSTNNDQNNNGGIMISRSASGIPSKSKSPTNTSSRSSYSGISNSGTNLKATNDMLQPKSYIRSKSRELTPAIEAAGEKFSQLNSGTLKRISPFEAYRRTKSKELPLEAPNKDAPNVKLKSPPPGPERAKSPFERARNSIERQFERAKSPLSDRAANRKSESSVGLIRAPPTPNLNRAASMGREQKDVEIVHGKDQILEKGNATEQEYHKESLKETNKDKESEKMKENEKKEKEKGQVKKTSSCDPEKPKSMYKLLASRFNRSGSNVPEGSNRPSTDKRPDEDDTSEREEKFKLKRPSRFLKHKTEKSSSKSSICEGETSQDNSERTERKPSKKLTDALNKFLGRKDSKEEHKLSVNSSPQLAVSGSGLVDDLPRKPPRVKPKKFSKSQENLSRVEEGGEMVMGLSQAERAQSVLPHDKAPQLQPGFTLESVTKSICDHLSQLENDISSRIGNMNLHDSETHVVSSNGSRAIPTASSVPSLTTYGLSPGLASRRNARPTNLDIAAASRDSCPPTNSSTTKRASVVTSPTIASKIENEEVKYANIKSLGVPGEVTQLEDGSQTPTESGESTTSGGDELKGQSENDDESVMDRITRKSYYSRFQELKKKPKLRRANTKEDMDQQLAAAKARLMKEETQKTVRDALSPLRFSGPSPVTSPRTSITSPPSWDPIRKHSRKSLPPEDLSSTYLMGPRRGTSLQPDDLVNIKRHTSVQPDDKVSGRLPSLPPEDRPYNQRASSVTRDKLSSHHRHSKSIPPASSNSMPTSPIMTSNEATNGEQVQDPVAVAVAAGAMAGEAAAEGIVDGARENRRSKSRERSVSRLRSPEAVKLQTSAQEETRNMAREELSRRLTHLTRISGTSGLSGLNRGGKAGVSTNTAADKGGLKPYRRTNTAGHVGNPSPGLAAPGAGVMERPVYRRTNTMDLPPADARARPGSEYRRLLQDPARRYSATRTLVEEDTSSTSPTRISSSIRHTSPSISSPSSTSSPSSSTSSSYRHHGYSTMDSLPRYIPSVLDTTSRHYSSSSSSTISPFSRRLSFYRY